MLDEYVPVNFNVSSCHIDFVKIRNDLKEFLLSVEDPF